MTHGHELRAGGMLEGAGAGRRGIKGRKKWDNCNIIINKIYLKYKKRKNNVVISMYGGRWDLKYWGIPLEIV